MRPVFSSGFKLAVIWIALAQMASACGNPKTDATAGPKAKLVVQTSDSSVRIGEAVYASLILPEKSPLPTGTLNRASCTSFQFHVEPATGWHDPWADWYNSGIPQHATGRDGPFRCGVSASMITIFGEPRPVPPPQITFTLNDWVQFDRPGKYKISVTYRTEFRSYQDQLDDPYDDRKTEQWVVLTTDPIEVEILPEAANAADQAGDSLAQLRRYYGQNDPVNGESRPFWMPQWAAYSETEAVVPLFAQFFETDFNSGKRGLIGSPHQELAVREMEKALVDPRHSVSFFFMDVLAFDAARLRHPELFEEWTASQWSQEWEELARKRNQVYLHAMAEYTSKLLASIPGKHESAQKDSLNAVLMVLSRWDVPEKEELRKRARREAEELWPKMKEPPMISEEEWRVVASPALAARLRKTPLYDQLHWLSEPSPEEAWPRMLAAAKRGDWAEASSWAPVNARVGLSSHRLDRQLIKAFDEGTDDDQLQASLDSLLLAFGGAELVPEVRELLASQTCMGQPSLWTFLLQHEGKRAEVRLIDRYSKQASDRSCDADVALQEALLLGGGRYWSRELETIVDSQLDKEDGIAIQAAILLQRHGSPNAERVLWARLQKWHQSPPFRFVYQGQSSIANVDDLEYALIQALLNGQSWLPEQTMIARLHTLCVYQCGSLKLARSVDQIQPLTVDGMAPPFRDDPSVDELRSLRRFPPGTRFKVNVSLGGPLSSELVDARYPALGRFMREQKFIIVDTSAFDRYGRCRQPAIPATRARRQ